MEDFDSGLHRLLKEVAGAVVDGCSAGHGPTWDEDGGLDQELIVEAAIRRRLQGAPTVDASTEALLRRRLVDGRDH